MLPTSSLRHCLAEQNFLVKESKNLGLRHNHNEIMVTRGHGNRIVGYPLAYVGLGDGLHLFSTKIRIFSRTKWVKTETVNLPLFVPQNQGERVYLVLQESYV
ncbi:unnamed protein product [Lactuca saligna]|uniref:Uncharacterized protein n=1 Tax=Lactuca saligna TaxID=75948 RepID=A0AA35YSH1_LACSI|nr:unnamed protein product [Lactuca saligna]